MKKLLLLAVVALSMSLVACGNEEKKEGQTKEEVPEAKVQAKAYDVETIRKMYYDLKNEIAMQNKNEGTLTFKSELPGSGKQKFNCTFYSTPYQGQNDGSVKDIDLQFMQCNYNIGSKKYYEEYFYDEDCNLIFVFVREPLDFDNREFFDSRIYINGDKVIHKILSKTTGEDVVENEGVKKQHNQAIDRARLFMKAFEGTKAYMGNVNQVK